MMTPELRMKMELRSNTAEGGVTHGPTNALSKRSFGVGQVQDSKDFKKCLESNAYNVNLVCKDSPPWLKWFPIHVAASASFNSLSMLLETTGVEDINQLTADKKTALHIACAYENWDAVKLLVKKGCNIMIQNNEGFVAYDFIADPEKCPREVVELVIPKFNKKTT